MIYDKDIREPLFDFLDETFGKNRILEEKIIGNSRADVVMVTPEAIFGIEIKSDADTYARLKSQVKDYDKYYDLNFVVVGTSHAAHIEEHVPDYWGIITVEEVDNNLDFYILRRPEPNPKVTWKRKLEMLWRPEIAVLQDEFKMPKYREKSKKFVLTKVLERLENGKIDPKEFTLKMNELLIQRDYNSISETLKEYKLEKRKRIEEMENDPEKRLELERKREIARQNFGTHRRRRRRRRR
ncbi:MAG: sce7726 family protein [Lachnospiraceae bacterium]|nr:sce7726 family protein [Lachnospiraceae bacterium]